MTFRSSGPSSPLTMLKLSTNASDMSLITPVTASSGSNTNTDSQLKQSCTVAPAKALKQSPHRKCHWRAPNFLLMVECWHCEVLYALSTVWTPLSPLPASEPQWCWWQMCQCLIPWWWEWQIQHPALYEIQNVESRSIDVSYASSSTIILRQLWRKTNPGGCYHAQNIHSQEISIRWFLTK